MKVNREMPYEKQAMNGDPLPIGLEYPDQILYLGLRLLYKSYRMGFVSREQATEEKRLLLTEYDKALYRHSMGQHWVDLVKRIEVFTWRYRKNKTIENADLLLDVIDDMPIPRQPEG